MARSLANKPNVDTTDPDFPYGRIIDDTGINDGTPIDENVYGDFHQFFEKLLDDGDVAANEQPESDADGYQYNEALENWTNLLIGNNATVSAANAAWTTAGGTFTITPNTGTVVVDAPDKVYNKYKLIGKTLFWQIQLRNVTITGAPGSIAITLPASIIAASLHIVNTNSFQMGWYNGETLMKVNIGGVTDKITLSLPAAASFTNGTNDQGFDINIVFEVA